jgi:hypothetical protein
MIRLLAAAALLTVAAAPVFACDLEKSVSTDTQKRVVASQPANDHTAPPPKSTADRKSS